MKLHEILEAPERLNLLLKLLKQSGFYAKAWVEHKPCIRVFHLTEDPLYVSVHGDGWAIEELPGFRRDAPRTLAKLKKKIVRTEEAVIDYLNSYRKVKEALDSDTSLDIAEKWLEKNGFWAERNDGHVMSYLTIRNVNGVADLSVNDDDLWNIDWYHGGSIFKRQRGLSFEKAMKALKPLKTTPLPSTMEAVTPGYKVHDGEAWERPASAPLIWRAVKHATEVEHRRVWSTIPGAKGDWSVRYSKGQSTKQPISELKYFYIKVLLDEEDANVGALSTWFEIIPEDDDYLEIHPDGVGDYEVVDPTGKFHP